MITRQATVRNQYGIHCRPAAMIAREAHACTGKIRVTNEQGESTNAKNVMGLISLGVTCGQSVTVEVEGEEEEAAATRMVNLLETEFDFVR